MWCLPATQFCCGCTVSFGVKFVLIVHFFANLFVVLETGGALIWPSVWGQMDFQSDSTTQQVLIAMFCLAGLPIIVMGLIGVARKLESLVRFYFLYMVACFILDMCLVAKKFIFTRPCDNLPGVLAQNGQAWGCGVARTANVTIVFLMTVIQCYLIFVVWSYCEDLAEGGAGNLKDLAIGGGGKAGRMRRGHHGGGQDPYGQYGGAGRDADGGVCGSCTGILCCFGAFDFCGCCGFSDHDEGLGGWGGGEPYGNLVEGGFGTGNYGSSYDKIANSGLGGSRHIFNGRYHELRFPPPATKTA